MDSPRKGGFNFKPLSQILFEPQPEVPWLVDGLLIKGGLSTLIAKPKIGKSTLAKTLVLAVSKGEDFLGMSTEKSKVLYLGLEDHAGEFQSDFLKLCADGTEDIDAHIGLAPPNPIDFLRDEISRRRPGLVIVDTLMKLIRVADVNDYAKTNNAFEPLLALARDTGTHILCVHHAKKGKSKDGENTLGSTAIEAMVDVTIYLQKNGNYRTLSTSPRFGAAIENLNLEMDPDTKRIFVSGNREKAEISSLGHRIFAFVKANPGCSALEIEEAIKARAQNRDRALKEELRAGRLLRTGDGLKTDPFRHHVKLEEILVPALRKNDGNQKELIPGSQTSPKVPEQDFPLLTRQENT